MKVNWFDISCTQLSEIFFKEFKNDINWKVISRKKCFQINKKLSLFIKTQLIKGYYEDDILYKLLKCDYDYECAAANFKYLSKKIY